MAYSLGPGLLVSASNSQPQEFSSNPIFPAAIWRRTPPNRGGEGFSVSVTWGYTSLAVARWFTPGNMLPPLRGSYSSC